MSVAEFAATSDRVDRTFIDADRRVRQVSEETARAIEAELAIPVGDADRGPLILRRGDALPEDAAAIVTERGRDLPPVTRGIEFGYHTLILRDGTTRGLVVSPGRCRTTAGLRGWGWAAQLYAARSSRSWGMGDLGDLRTLTKWTADRGGAFVMINPLHAPLMTTRQEPSPYYAASRLFRSPLYLAVDALPGIERIEGYEALRREAHDLNAATIIDRDHVWRVKRTALERLWAATVPPQEFDRFCAAGGRPLENFARFCALTERHDAGWHSWPTELHDPTSAAVAALADGELRDRVRFHTWLQWLLDHQVSAAAAAETPVMHDLAVGVNPDGADVWANPGIYSREFEVGAPPDRFNTDGQNWGLPPFNPRLLRAAGFQPFIDMFRAVFAAGHAVRIDHVMGLFRLWWVPRGARPTEGAYVRYPARELLDLLALESHRSGAFVVGEDLGTVEPGVRAELRRRNILSYRLVAFGGGAALQRYPVHAMAAVSTHDLPTIAGLWTGADLADQQARGMHPNVEATARSRTHLATLTGSGDHTSIAEVVTRTYAVLAEAPSRLLCASLEDAAVTPLRPNMPGTTHSTWPNWQIPLPQTLEQVLASPVTESIAASLRRS